MKIDLGLQEKQENRRILVIQEELKLSLSEIVKKLVTKFSLDETEAWEYVNAAMGVQQ